MTQVVTMSATTAAYAAQAVKPSARVSGDGPSEEAITLLSARPRDDQMASHAVAAMRNPTSLSLMLMSAGTRLPQRTSGDAIRRYREFDVEEWPEEAGVEDNAAQD